jgi:hypothetical protein
MFLNLKQKHREESLNPRCLLYIYAVFALVKVWGVRGKPAATLRHEQFVSFFFFFFYVLNKI